MSLQHNKFEIVCEHVKNFCSICKGNGNNFFEDICSWCSGVGGYTNEAESMFLHHFCLCDRVQHEDIITCPLCNLWCHC